MATAKKHRERSRRSYRKKGIPVEMFERNAYGNYERAHRKRFLDWLLHRTTYK